ncbi:MAG: TAXI family TRAP transporter solute-binding subunit [Synergistaceae bacterium]|jgi:TRAP transporter TAXI family solute receptor|nr:TAXI family TRAP transporter solute-binding subunit [Synergistaceae bacterium]
MKMGKTVYIIAILSVLVFASASACNAANASGASDSATKAQKLLYLGSASIGSASYAGSAGISTVISNNSDYISVNCQVTSGSNENYMAMLAGDMDIMNSDGGLAYRLGHPEIPGDSPMAQIYEFDANPDIRFFTNCEPTLNSYIVRADSNIKTVQDMLKPSVRIGFPTPGGVSYSRNKAFFEALGFKLDDLNIYYAERNELVDAFKDGNIDVIVSVIGNISLPNSTFYELSHAADIRLVSVDEETMAIFNSICPAYLNYTIPAGWMRGVDSEVVSVLGGNNFLISKDMPDDVVYDMCKALFENLEELYQIGESFRYITKETAAADVPCPIHPGALKYYEENGFKITYIPDYD